MRQLLSLVFFASLIFSANARSEATRNFEQSLPLDGVERLHLTVHIGTVLIKPAPDKSLQFSLEVSEQGGWFGESLDLASVEALNDKGTLDLKLAQEGYHEAWVLYLPEEIALDLEVGVGEVTINALNQSANINIGVGSAAVSLTAATTGELNAVSGVGDITLEANTGATEQERHIVGNKVSWQGTNTNGHTVDILIGVGSGTITITDNQT